MLKKQEKVKHTFVLNDIANSINCNIVYGYPELDGNNLFNSCMLIMSDGRFYNYRKTHLFNREKLFFSPEIPVFRFLIF